MLWRRSSRRRSTEIKSDGHSCRPSVAAAETTRAIAGPGKTFSGKKFYEFCFIKWRILVYFIFLNFKHRTARGNFPLPHSPRTCAAVSAKYTAIISGGWTRCVSHKKTCRCRLRVPTWCTAVHSVAGLSVTNRTSRDCARCATILSSKFLSFRELNLWPSESKMHTGYTAAPKNVHANFGFRYICLFSRPYLCNGRAYGTIVVVRL